MWRSGEKTGSCFSGKTACCGEGDDVVVLLARRREKRLGDGKDIGEADELDSTFLCPEVFRRPGVARLRRTMKTGQA